MGAIRAPALEYLMTLAVTFEPPPAIVDSPLWERRVLRVASGSFEGPMLAGAAVSGGDWVLIRRDASAELDIRFTLTTAEDELIYFRSTGLFVASTEVAVRIRGGETVPPAAYYFRTAILLETGAPRLRGLNHLLCIGVGQRTPTGMITDVFSVH